MKQLGTAKFRRFAMVALATGLIVQSHLSQAQVVPVPFAAQPFAGINATTTTFSPCATSIPDFQVPGVTPVYNWGDGCPANTISASSPLGLAVDSYGNVFFADSGHDTIRVVYEGGAALAQAIVNANPQTTTLTTGNIQKGYVYNLVGGVQAVPASPYFCNGTTSGLQANPQNSRMDGCPGSEAYILPRGIALDNDGNLFFGAGSIEVFYIGGTKAKNLILATNAIAPKITAVTPGYVYLVAGANSNGYSPDGQIGVKAVVNSPRGLTIDSNENVIFADYSNSVVREINGTTGVVTTVAGLCLPTSGAANAPCKTALQAGYPMGYGDGGPAASAEFDNPWDVALDANGNLFIADSAINGTASTPLYGRVRVVYVAGTLPGISNPVVGNIYTYAGGGSQTTSNIPALNIQFDSVQGLHFDAAGYLYVTEHRNLTTTSNHVWRIDPYTGIATIVAGSGIGYFSTFNVPCKGTKGPVVTDRYGDGCPGPQAFLSLPVFGYVFDAFGNAYIADGGTANMIRKFPYNIVFPSTPAVTSSTPQYISFDVPTGTVTTGLGLSSQGVTGAEFTDVGATTDTCTLPFTFTADTVCSFDVKFTPAAIGLRIGVVQVNGAAGSLGTQFLSGTGAAAALAIDPGTMGTLGSGITPEGVAVDENGNAYLSDGKGNQVLKVAIGGGTPVAIVTGLNAPRQVGVDGQGTVYVTDSGNNRIVRVPTSGTTTYLGTGLNSPQGLAVDFEGNVYVADTGNGRVVKLGAVTGIQTTLYLSGLTSPSSLTIDPLGNLYIVDTGAKDIVELPLGGTQQVLSLPTNIVTPVALSVDPAGNYYIADSTALQVIEVPVAGGSTSPLVIGLNNPVGIAMDRSGSLYLADSGNTSVTSVNRRAASLSFPLTNVYLQSNPIVIRLTSMGYQNLTLATPVYTPTVVASNNFSVSPTTTGGCAGGEVLAPGFSCQLTAISQPQVSPGPFPEALSALLTFTPSSPAGINTVTASLTGTAVNNILTTTTAVPSASNPLVLGQTLVVSTTVTPNSGTGTPTGTVTYDVDGAVPQPVSIVNGIVPPLTLNLLAGTHVITIAYGGDSSYAPSAATMLTIIVIKDPTVTNLSVAGSVNTTSGVSGLLLTAAISSSISGTIGGTVTFTNTNGGTTLSTLGTATVTNGVATLLTTATVYPSYTFAASYSGNANYQPSSGTGAEAPDFVIITPPGGVTVYQGSQVSLNPPSLLYPNPPYTMTLVPINGYTGNVVGSCTGLPANSFCRFSYPTSVGTINTTCTGYPGSINTCPTLQIFSGVDPNTATIQAGQHKAIMAILFGWPAALVLLFGIRQRRVGRAYSAIVWILVMLATCAGLSACGSTPVPTVYVTPAGTYSVTITYTDTNQLTRTAVLPVVMEP